MYNLYGLEGQGIESLFKDFNDDQTQLESSKRTARIGIPQNTEIMFLAERHSITDIGFLRGSR